MKWYVLLLSVLGLTLLIGCSNLVHTAIDTETEEIDGGTQHYVNEDAPKTVESTEIVSFSCEFSTTDLELSCSPIAGRYYTLYAAQDGGSYEARGGGDIYGQREFTPDAVFFDALQQIVVKYDFAQYNGQFYTVGGLPPDFGAELDIQYDSGERIRASDNQSCFLPLEAMEELVSLFCPADSESNEQE